MKRICKGVRVFSVILIICLFSSPPLGAGSYQDIEDIRFSLSGSSSRIVIEFKSLPVYKSNRLTNPERIYFDLKNTRLGRQFKPVVVNNGQIKEIRASQYNSDTVRVVIELSKAGKYDVFTLSSPPRLVIDIGSDENPFYRERKIIVLDPGHGGHDPGAIGASGLTEKDVTLDIARRVRRILEEDYNLEVHLTRESDAYLELDERTRYANSKKADLFVSVHANASHKRLTAGVETYFLNWTNDAEALRVAARENRISVEKMKQSQSELGMILTSLERESKRDESLRLAHYIQRSLISGLSTRYSGMNDLGVKHALFYVLVGAEMPSVLVEVAFISNPREEKLLRNKSFRDSAAKSLASGIYRYILSLPDAPRLAMSGENLPQLYLSDKN